jgi:hypothetical protein
MIFWKVWTIFVGITAGLLAAYQYGYVGYVLENDATRISVGVLVLFLACSVWIGWLSYRHPAEEAPNWLWFISDACMSLGMVGTLLGFLIVLSSSFGSIDAADTEAMKTVITAMGSGMGTALLTSLVGLGASILLKFQLVVLEG